MRHSIPSRLKNASFALFAAMLVAGCQSRPTPAAQPEPEATSLLVRNFTGHEVSVYAVPRANAQAVWLTNVPVDGLRSVSIRWSDLQASGGLVVRTQVVGSTKSWTSRALIIDEGIVGVLDLKLGPSLTTANSQLRGVTTQAFNAAMR